MKVLFTGFVSEVYVTDKGAQYLTFFEQSTGGQVKVSMSGAVSDLHVGEFVIADLEVTPRADRAGGIFLRYDAGNFKRQKISISEEGSK